VIDAFAVRTARDVLRVHGPDAVTFLQGQLSQDVVRLEVGSCAWTFVLQPQGKVDAWFRITREAEDSYLADVDAGYGAVIATRLQRFKLRVKLDIEALAWQCVAVRGVAAATIDADACGAVLAAPVDWAGTEGVDLLGPVVTWPAGVREGTTAELDAWRVAVGMPAMGLELDESTIPAEAGVVERSVSFTKGCYTGQELVARIDSRGNRTPRRLRRVVVPVDAIPAGFVAGAAVLAADGHDVGVLTTVAPGAGRALAYVRREVEPPASVSVDGAPATVEVLPER
jgi:tRNA-modifying protein YgfZ